MEGVSDKSSSFLTDIMNRFRKSVEPLSSGGKKKKEEDEIIQAVIERIHVDGEDHRTPLALDTEEGREEMYRRLIARLKNQIKAAGITTDELFRSYNGPVNCIVLMKFVEKYTKKRQDGESPLRDRIITGGWRHLQNGVWVLPPVKTPREVNNQDDLKLWVYQNLVKPSGKDLQYVFPFVSLLDLKKTIGDKRRVLKKPASNTIFSIMETEEIVPSKHIYEYMKTKGMSIEDIINSGDITFLASAFADEATMEALVEGREKLKRKVQKIMETSETSLSYIASLHEKEFADALHGFVSHPTDFAQRLIIEARYWDIFVHGQPEMLTAPAGPETAAASGTETITAAEPDAATATAAPPQEGTTQN